MKKILALLKTDLIHGKIIRQDDEFGIISLLFLFFRSKSCRIHLFVRLRRANFFLAFMAKVYLGRFFIEIAPTAHIGKYFWFPHPRCIIIAGNVVIGNYVNVGQYVTVGGNFKKTKKSKNGQIQKLPVLGNRINISPGAVIGGPVTLGDDIIVGANAVVTRDVPNNTIVYGQNEFAKKRISIPPEGGEFNVIE